MFSKVIAVALPVLARGASAPVSVFGHLAPDTDAISAALAYTWLLKEEGHDAKAFRLAGDINPETQYVLKTLGLEAPPLLEDVEPKQTVAIVDTNNPKELPKGLEKAKILSIVDHHKLSGLTNSEPVHVDIRPLCSAGSIIYAKAKAAGIKVPKTIAGLMLSSILSDSLEFRSPTTTEIDKTYAKELGAIAGLDVHKHAEAMLDAKGQVGHLSPRQLLLMDSKVFTMGGKKIRVSVLETTQPKGPLEKQTELVADQKAIIADEKLDDMLFFVVDILKESATFVSCSQSGSTMIEKAWSNLNAKVNAQGLAELPGVLSRKKQMIPALEAVAQKNEL